MNHFPSPGGDMSPGGSGTPPGYPYYPHAPNPYKRPVRRNSNIVAGGLILLEAISYVVSKAIVEALIFLVPQEIRLEFPPALLQLISIFIYALCFGIPLILMVYFIRIPIRVAFPMRRVGPGLLIPALFFCLGIALLGSVVSNIIGGLFNHYAGVSPVQPDMSPPVGLSANVLYFISIAILPAILEEMMFRGVIMQSLRRFGDGFALVISAMLFSFCHGNLVQGPPTFFVGLAIGYFVLRSGSLVAGMVIHFANNAFAVIFDWTYFYGGEFASGMADTFFFLFYIVAPALSLLFLVFRHSNMFQVAPSSYPLYESQKYALYFTSAMPILYLVITIISTILWFA